MPGFRNAICAWRLLVVILLGSLSCPAQSVIPIGTLAEAVEQAEKDAWRRLVEVPREMRDADWHYLSTLSWLARGEHEEALKRCRRLLEEYHSPRAYLLKQFLLVHRGEDVSGEVPAEVWRRNPSFRGAQKLIQWTQTNLNQRGFAISSIASVEHYGAWPPPLGALGKFRAAEPATPAGRLKWLNEDRHSLLVRLTGSTPRRPLDLRRGEGRWVLVTTLRAGEPVGGWIAAGERLWQLSGDVPLVFLWLRELSPGSDSDEWRSALTSVRLPLFVAATRDAVNFQTPGFERGGVSLLISPQLSVRLVIDRGIPLPVLSEWIRQIISRGAE